MTLPPSFRSPYDQQVHLIRTSKAGGVTEALCEHSVPAANAIPAGNDDEPRCFSCLLMWGAELDKRGDADRWAL